MANPRVVVDFVADTSKLQAGMATAGKSSAGFAGKLKGLGKAGAVGAAVAGIGLLTETFRVGIDEFTEGQKVAAQTNAVLKSTGGVAKVSAKHVDDLASSIMKKSGLDDEAIASGENLLLTFTRIRNEAGKGNDVFDQTTRLMADMSVALGQDMKTSAVQLGKALNDPVKGVSALQRVGVSFTKAQKDQIKALEDSGQHLKAQKIVLGELKKEFGGSAEAAGKTLPGQLNILKQSFSNLAGDLVAKLAPALQATITYLRDHWPQIQAAFDQAWGVIQPILKNLGDLASTVAGIVKSNWDTIGPVVTSVATTIQNAGRIIAAALKLVTDLLKGDWSAAWADMKRIVSVAIGEVQQRISTALAVFKNLATKLGGAILSGVVAGLTGIGNAAWDVINNIGAVLAGVGGTILGWGRRVGDVIVSGVLGGLRGIGNEAWDVIKGIGSVLANVGGTILGWGQDIGSAIVRGLVAAIKGAAGAITSAVKAPLNAAISAFNGIRIPGFKIPMPGPIPDIHFPGIGFPDIPLLAAGGIVTRPTLAMVGEAGPEAVLPLGRSGAVEVRVFIGDEELRGIVRTEVRAGDTRTARTLLAGLA